MKIKKTLAAIVTAASIAIGGCSKDNDPFYIPPPSTECNISEYEMSLRTQQEINQMAATGTYNLNTWELAMADEILWDFKAGTPEFFGYLYLIDGGTKDIPNAQVYHKTMFVYRDLIHATYASGHLFARVKHGADHGIYYSREQYEADMQALWYNLSNTIGGDIEIPYIPPINATLDALGDYYWRQNLCGWLAHEAGHILGKHAKEQLCYQLSGATPDLLMLFSQQCEAESDAGSVDLLQKAYNAGRNVHPIGSLFFLENMKTAKSLLTGPEPPSHPPLADRFAIITAELAARGHPTDLWGNWPTPYSP